MEALHKIVLYIVVFKKMLVTKTSQNIKNNGFEKFFNPFRGFRDTES